MNESAKTNLDVTSTPPLMRIEVAYSAEPRSVELLTVQLPAGSTVRQALQASGLTERVPESVVDAAAMRRNAPAGPGEEDDIDTMGGRSAGPTGPTGAGRDGDGEGAGDGRTWRGLSMAVFGRKLTLDSELFDGDRLDCCRPLRVDPKLARRERFNQQGSRRSGLFAKRREGSVAGY